MYSGPVFFSLVLPDIKDQVDPWFMDTAWYKVVDNFDSAHLSSPMELTDPAPILTGSKVSLSQMLESDVTPSYLRWITDPDINKYLESRFQTHSLDSLRRYVRDLRHNPGSMLFKIELVESHEHVGNVKLGPIDWNHRFADTGILIGDEKQHGRGIGTESMILLRDYAFEVLALRKLIASAYEDNIGSMRLFERAGFEVEGVRKSQYLSEGGYTGLVLMGCRKESLNG